MERAICSTAAMEYVTSLTLGKNAFVPMLMTTASITFAKMSSGSIQELDMTKSTVMPRSTAQARMGVRYPISALETGLSNWYVAPLSSKNSLRWVSACLAPSEYVPPWALTEYRAYSPLLHASSPALYVTSVTPSTPDSSPAKEVRSSSVMPCVITRKVVDSPNSAFITARPCLDCRESGR